MEEEVHWRATLLSEIAGAVGEADDVALSSADLRLGLALHEMIHALSPRTRHE